MTGLLTIDEMTVIEHLALESDNATGLEQMQRTGEGIADAICTQWPELLNDVHEAAVFCGPGITGVFGVFAAKALAARELLINLYHCDLPDIINPASLQQRNNLIAPIQRFLSTHGKAELPAMARLDEGFDGNHVVIDAAFGRELVRPIPLYWREILGCIGMYSQNPRLVALDLPSGFDAKNGQLIDFTAAEIVENGYIVEMRTDAYDLTVSLSGDCKALHTDPCASYCGQIVDHPATS